eukprot:TRINITY_DN5750_c0_g1_i1.p1 TRINITY_DN5750_c0_g1~~TRINITY_DN5750_c0_g1_i1.p1  ORF type:complete len:267 (+),score=21.94 TRINITY_DN5750_c0_g1_i1:104-904(+)
MATACLPPPLPLTSAVMANQRAGIRSLPVSPLEHCAMQLLSLPASAIVDRSESVDKLSPSRKQMQTVPSLLTGPCDDPEAIENRIHNTETCVTCQLIHNYGQRPRPTPGDCTVCNEHKELHYCAINLGVEQIKERDCGHAFCQDCLKQWYTPQIKQGRIRLECMESGCRQQLEIDDVHAFDMVLADQFREAKLASLRRRELDDTMKDMLAAGAFQQCPDCKSLIERSEGCNFMVCSQCLCEFCYDCGDAYSTPDNYQCSCGPDDGF